MIIDQIFKINHDLMAFESRDSLMRLESQEFQRISTVPKSPDETQIAGTVGIGTKISAIVPGFLSSSPRDTIFGTGSPDPCLSLKDLRIADFN